MTARFSRSRFPPWPDSAAQSAFPCPCECPHDTFDTSTGCPACHRPGSRRLRLGGMRPGNAGTLLAHHIARQHDAGCPAQCFLQALATRIRGYIRRSHPILFRRHGSRTGSTPLLGSPPRYPFLQRPVYLCRDGAPGIPPPVRFPGTPACVRASTIWYSTKKWETRKKKNFPLRSFPGSTLHLSQTIRLFVEGHVMRTYTLPRFDTAGLTGGIGLRFS